MVQFFEYDALGRQKKQYLPYESSGTDLDYLSGAATEQSTFYTNKFGDSHPYSELSFDNSPYNEVTAAQGPGDAWQAYTQNVSFTAVSGTFAYWKYAGADSVASATYPENSVTYTTGTDEDQKSVKTYTNTLGQTLCSEKDGKRTWFTYDDYGNLRYAVQGDPTGTIADYLDKYSYYYEYNSKGLVTKKKVPGMAYITFDYDAKNRVIRSQNGRQREAETSVRIYYDSQDRITATQLCYEGAKGSKAVDPNDPPLQTVYTTFSGYDNYDFSEFTRITGIAVPAGLPATSTRPDADYHVRGKSTFSAVRNEIDNSWLFTVVFYDIRGRVIQTYSTNHLGGYDRVTNEYDFAGKVLNSLHEHTPDKVNFTTILSVYDYDPAGRLHTTSEKINNGTLQQISHLEYTELGQVKRKDLHKKADGTYVQSVDYSYNIRGQLTGINDVAVLGTDFYAQKINYDQNRNGSVSSLEWTSKKFTAQKKFAFTYDALNRLESCVFSENGTVNNAYNMTLTYDGAFNQIKTLTRNGRNKRNNITYTEEIDQLVYDYSGYRLRKVTDNCTSPGKNQGFTDGNVNGDDYLYDSNGNMTQDNNKGISAISYNSMDLITQITFSGNNSIQYGYTSGGQKLRTKIFTGGLVSKTTDYAGRFVYENNKLAHIQSAEGRIVVSYSINEFPSQFFREYQIKDYQGNVVCVFEQNGKILQENSYYPFGMPMNLLSYNVNALTMATKAIQHDWYFRPNQDQYNNHETQTDFNLGWVDYGFRQLDPVLGVWHGVDKMAEKYPDVSPYAYCGNDPINRTDFMGLYGVEHNSEIWSKYHGRKPAFEFRTLEGGDNGERTDAATALSNLWSSPNGGNWSSSDGVVNYYGSDGGVNTGYYNTSYSLHFKIQGWSDYNRTSGGLAGFLYNVKRLLTYSLFHIDKNEEWVKGNGDYLSLEMQSQYDIYRGPDNSTEYDDLIVFDMKINHVDENGNKTPVSWKDKDGNNNNTWKFGANFGFYNYKRNDGGINNLPNSKYTMQDQNGDGSPWEEWQPGKNYASYELFVIKGNPDWVQIHPGKFFDNFKGCWTIGIGMDTYLHNEKTYHGIKGATNSLILLQRLGYLNVILSTPSTRDQRDDIPFPKQ
jgi:RHS repeat-associated protein